MLLEENGIKMTETDWRNKWGHRKTKDGHLYLNFEDSSTIEYFYSNTYKSYVVYITNKRRKITKKKFSYEHQANKFVHDYMRKH
jgi:hypothetical protein